MVVTAKNSAKLAIVAALLASGACKPRDESGLFNAPGGGGSEQPAEAADVSATGPASKGKGSYPQWVYDAGPGRDTTAPGFDVNAPMTEVGKSLVELNARIPYFPGLSQAIYGDQMFRPAFGPIPWRMMQKPNSVKILFIGQDGTHIAEAAGRPATAGFGGRAQDLAKYFGVGSSAAFINTFAYTIKWQYGAFDTPAVWNSNGTNKYKVESFTGNQVWLISQDQDSPLVKWRNDLISWIIKNNRQSLKMIVLFGGGARDAMGAYVSAKGGKVGTRYTDAQLHNVKIPEFELTGAGSNKQTAFPLSKQGTDLYKEFNNGQTPNYKDQPATQLVQKNFAANFNQSAANAQSWMNKMVLPKDGQGLYGSGMLHPAQLGGYDIDEGMEIPAGHKTISLKGLRIDNEYTVDHDVLVAQLPHPTMLSMLTPEQASQKVGEGLRAFAQYPDWRIEADPGETDEGEHYENRFATGQPYQYKRGDMGTEFYDFGAPASRMVNVSTASRNGANVIVFGTREQAPFDNNLLKKMTNGPDAKSHPFQGQDPSNAEMWIARPQTPDRRYTFDPGPPLNVAKLMKASLPQDAAFKDARKNNGDYAHYRGTFNQPKVIILADPHGYDDLITARALTGSRGQYLQGLMSDLGVGDKYLVLKTAPYAKDNLWTDTLAKTRAYRDAVWGAILRNEHPQLIIADGPDAQAELARIAPNAGAPVARLNRPTEDPKAGLDDQAFLSAVRAVFPGTPSGKMVNIPRSHMTYYARVWEGTSGDRVITASNGPMVGVAFAEVAPQWAYTQDKGQTPYRMPQAEVDGCKALAAKLNQNKMRMGLEKISTYLARLQSGTPGTAKCGAATGDLAADGATAGAGSTAVVNAAMRQDVVDPAIEHVDFFEPQQQQQQQ